MKTRFVEATQGIDDGFNWGKFMVGCFDGDEWTRTSAMGKTQSSASAQRRRVIEVTQAMIDAAAREFFEPHVLEVEGPDAYDLAERALRAALSAVEAGTPTREER